jgi:hypothetical protein
MTAGQLAEHFDCAKLTLSAHFAVLREADLVESEKVGTTVTYSLKLSVLEDALLSFAETVDIGVRSGGNSSWRPGGSSDRPNDGSRVRSTHRPDTRCGSVADRHAGRLDHPPGPVRSTSAIAVAFPLSCLQCCRRTRRFGVMYAEQGACVRRPAVEAAKRAIELSQPFDMFSPSTYDLWETLEIRFDLKMFSTLGPPR